MREYERIRSLDSLIIGRRSHQTALRRLALLAIAVAFSPGAATAASGLWIDTTSGGLWSTTSNWVSGTVANGTDANANFSAFNITADDTVHLDSSRTVGSLLFGDSTPSNNWILDNNGISTNVLTLAVSSGSPSITVNNDQATISAVIAGSQGLTINGPGMLVFSGSLANTYSGTTTVASGTLVLNKSVQTNAVPGNLSIGLPPGGASAIVQLAASNQISDTATVTINPTGLLSIPNGTQDYVPTLILNGGSVTTGTGAGCFLGFINNSGQVQTIGNATTSTISGVLNLNDDSSHSTTFTITPGASSGIDLDIPASIVAGGIVKTGVGNMRLSGANSFSSGLAIQQGAVVINSINNAGVNGPLGANSIVGLGSTNFTGFIEYTGGNGSSNMNFSLAGGGRGEFLVDSAGATLDLSGVFSGSGVLNKQSPGTLYLTSANSIYSGGTTLSQGTLEIGASSFAQISGVLQQFFVQNGPLGIGPLSVGGSGILSTDGGNYTINNPTSFSGFPTLAGGQLTFANGVTPAFVAGDSLTGSTTMTVNNLTTIVTTVSGGFGLTVAAGSTGTLYLANGGNTFTGGATLAGGTLKIGAGTTVASGAISSGPVGTGTLTLSGGTFQSDGGTYSLANQVNLSGSTTLSGGAISFDPQGTSSTVALAGPASLTVNNTTTIIGAVTGANSLTLPAGSTGTLYLSGKLPVIVLGTNGATGSTFSGGMIVAGGTLEIGASSKVGGLFGSNFVAAGPVGAGTLTMTGGTLESDGGSYTLNNSVNLSGSVTLTGLSGGSLTFDPNILSNGILLSGDTILMVNNSTTVTDQIGGAHSLTLGISSGTLSLYNILNNFTGGMNLQGGTLQFGGNTLVSGGNINGGPLGVGPISLSVGTLQINGSATLANQVNLSGVVTTGGGPLTFDPAGLTTPSTVSLASDATLVANGLTTVKNVVTGNHILTLGVGSTGTLYLDNAGNNFAGMRVFGGTLEIHGSSTLQPSGQRFVTSSPVGDGLFTLSGGTLLGDGSTNVIGNYVLLGGNVNFAGGPIVLDSQSAPLQSPNVVELNANASLTINNSTTIASSIIGPHSLTLAAGSVGLLNISNAAGAETFGGGLTVLGGNLQINASSTVSGGIITQGPVGTGPLTLGGGTFLTDGGSYTLANPLFLSGNVNLTAGTLIFDPAGLQTSSVATLNSNTSLSLNNSTIIKNKVTGGHSLAIVSGNGLLDLTNSTSNYTGGTTLSTGTLELGASSVVNNAVLVSGPIGTGALTITGGTLRSDGGAYTLANQVSLRNILTLAGGPITFDPQSNGATFTLAFDAGLVVNNLTTIKSRIDTSFGLSMDSASTGTLYLTNPGNVQGGMGLPAGTLEVGASSVVNGGVLVSGPLGIGTLFFTGGTLASDGGNYSLGNNFSLAGALQLSDGPLTLDGQGDGAQVVLTAPTSLTVNNLTTIKDPIVGAFSLSLGPASTGTLDLTNPLNTFQGMTLNAGALEIGASSVVTGGGLLSGPVGVGALSLRGGTFESDGGPYIISNQLYLTGSVAFAGGPLTFDTQGYSATAVLQGNTILTVNNITTIDEQITGNFSLTLAAGSTGALRLSGANTFTGGVNLNGGTLFVGNDAALGTGTLTFGGGVLEADGGPRTIANPVTIATGPAVIDGPLDLTFSSSVKGTGGGLTKNGAGIFTLAAGGSLNGPLTVNQGTLNVRGNLTAIGATNFGSLNPSGGVTLTVNGSGLDNEGLLTISGSTLSGSGPIVNNNTLSGFGTIGGSGGFTNDAFLNITGGNLALTNIGSNYNYGEITLASGEFLQLGAGVGLTNAGGSITGPGVISANSFSDVSGVIVVGNGANLTIVHPWYNGGIVELTSLTSNVTGGAVTNFGTIQGLGAVSCNVTNSGSVEASGATLTLAGATINAAAGTLNVDISSKLIITAGLSTNAGTIVNQGGTFDNNSFPLNNTGVIAGFGVFRTGGTGLSNNGGISFTGGATTVIGPVANQNGRTITVAYNPALFTGMVTNNGGATFNILSTTATFAGGFTNSGNSNFAKAGSGEVDITAPPTLNSGSTLSVTSGTMKFNVVAGTPNIGTGVMAVVSNGATLELAGSVSALSSGTNRVNVTNNSSTSGIVVSGTNQTVGGVDGTGSTQIDAGSDFTADHIIQSALIISGSAKNFGLVTIAPSDASGDPIGRPMTDVDNHIEAVSLVASSMAPLITATGSAELRGGLNIGTSIPAFATVTALPISTAASIPEPSVELLVGIAAAVLALASVRGRTCGRVRVDAD